MPKMPTTIALFCLVFAFYAFANEEDRDCEYLVSNDWYPACGDNKKCGTYQERLLDILTFPTGNGKLCPEPILRPCNPMCSIGDAYMRDMRECRDMPELIRHIWPAENIEELGFPARSDINCERIAKFGMCALDTRGERWPIVTYETALMAVINRLVCPVTCSTLLDSWQDGCIGFCDDHDELVDAWNFLIHDGEPVQPYCADAFTNSTNTIEFVTTQPGIQESGKVNASTEIPALSHAICGATSGVKCAGADIERLERLEMRLAMLEAIGVESAFF